MDSRGLTFRRIALIAAAFAALSGMAVGLAWVSQSGNGVSGWHTFLLTELLAAGLVWGAFRLLRDEGVPRWLVWLVIGAAVLRLALGVFWTLALPVWGYPNETQQAGYVMYDPYLRDGDAWALSQSDQPLTAAFQGFSPHDQYGGLLFLSAWLYRTQGLTAHFPLLIVTLGSAVSGLGVLFVWGFALRLFGESIARWAAWGLALYPEAVLLGSSQMREAFTIPLSAALAYFLLRYLQDHRRRDLLAGLVVAAITAAISWAYLALLIVVLGLLLLGLFLEKRTPAKLTLLQILGLAAGGVGLAAGAAYVWRALSKMSDFQGYLTEAASGVMQAVYSRLPEILHIPFMVGYGLLRPLLPAAILEQGDSVLWRWVAIWRAAGWTVLLALLILVTIQVLRKRLWLKPAGMLVWCSWLMSVIAAYRAGGDMWDNPRYRAGFAVFQIALAAWAVFQQRQDRDPLLRRIVIFILIVMAWLFIWYLPRYAAVPWAVGKLESRLLAGLVSGMVYWLWDWYRLRAPRR